MNALAVRTDSARTYLEGIRDSYSANAKTFYRFMDACGLSNDPLAALPGYYDWLDKQGFRASTVRLKRAAALSRIRRLANIPGMTTPEQRRIIEWTIEELARANPAPKLQFNSVGREKVLTLEEYRAVQAGCRSARTGAILKFLYATGARVSEMTGIKLSDCTPVLGTVFIVVMGKGHKERTLRLPLAQFEAIRGIFNGSVYLFETSKGRAFARQYITGELRKLTMRTIGRSLSAHKMRHSWATRQFAKGQPIDAVSRYLGHADCSITLKFYSHCEMTDEALFEDDL